MLRRRRPLMRAAMVGGAGYMTYKAGQNVQERKYHEADQDAQLAQMQQAQMMQQQAPAQYPPAPPPAPPPQPPPAAATSPSPADSAAQRMEALSKAKELLDAGVLTPEEFNAEKQRLLRGG